MICMSVCINAQTHQRAGQKAKKNIAEYDSMNIFNAYCDSLAAYTQKRDSMIHDNEQQTANSELNGNMFRLFSPLTFYHSPAAKLLAINNKKQSQNEINDEIDNVLMTLYLKRPDLVRTTESTLTNAGSIRNDVINKDINIKKKDVVEYVKTIKDDETSFFPPATNLVIVKPNFWKYNGNGNLQFMQNYVSNNWYKGGESNNSMVGEITLNANYNNMKRLKIENKLELKLGFQTSRGDTLHKFKTNSDLIRYTGNLGIQAHNKWYYSMQLLAYTQFARGFKSNDANVYSDFFSPFNLNLGLGLDYSVATKNNRLKGNVNMSFLSLNFRYVDRHALHNSYKTGRHNTREEFGSQLTTNLEWKISNQITWKTRLYWYTSYKRTQVEWENTIAMHISKYVTTHIFMFPRFDDNSSYDDKLGHFQFQEYCSLGLGYSF